MLRNRCKGAIARDACRSALQQLTGLQALTWHVTLTPYAELCCVQRSGRKCFDSADFELQQQWRQRTRMSAVLPGSCSLAGSFHSACDAYFSR